MRAERPEAPRIADRRLSSGDVLCLILAAQAFCRWIRLPPKQLACGWRRIPVGNVSARPESSSDSRVFRAPVGESEVDCSTVRLLMDDAGRSGKIKPLWVRDADRGQWIAGQSCRLRRGPSPWHRMAGCSVWKPALNIQRPWMYAAAAVVESPVPVPWPATTRDPRQVFMEQ